MAFNMLKTVKIYEISSYCNAAITLKLSILKPFQTYKSDVHIYL